uniref:Putative secreted protein n=1 Tax=Ixodes ricinus TaxID=34613 RepID=A0A6B0U2B6_IXORI
MRSRKAARWSSEARSTVWAGTFLSRRCSPTCRGTCLCARRRPLAPWLPSSGSRPRRKQWSLQTLLELVSQATSTRRTSPRCGGWPRRWRWAW